ncbi:hypothetical protein DPSP01_003791 [Paraphaeosphaeria sporulosa]|uniref:Pathogenesis-related protein 1a n=1 Tax=Paraphaeosphaeria sporulosa TaxID=1460663 RepID=A0A177CSV1_9PLEO|nr:pathogenesis-related protein 1a [Paraphaeosphaeria sporulosa]OAG09970.1 pathogenesis-related protein 1a [Paraphaeosphaeria sporulosa]
MSDINDEQREALTAHNDARAQKNVQPLTWDGNLANDAQGYAQVLADTQDFKHSGVQGQGENLFMSSGDASLADAVRAWLGEEANYHGEKIGEGDFAAWGHYTQCMWHNTTNVAVAKARSGDGSTWIVGRYSPPGNWGGETPY